MADDKNEPELDEDGLEIHKYRSLVLLVVPREEFAEETLRYTRSSLYNVHVGTRVVSTSTEGEVKGRLQDEFLVDGTLAGESMDGYSGVVFVGGEGARALVGDADALRLAREAAEAGKLVGAWGDAVAILCQAGVLKGRRFTGSDDLREVGKRTGGRYTGKQVEVSGSVVTGRDDAVGMRFGQKLAQLVGI